MRGLAPLASVAMADLLQASIAVASIGFLALVFHALAYIRAQSLRPGFPQWFPRVRAGPDTNGRASEQVVRHAWPSEQTHALARVYSTCRTHPARTTHRRLVAFKNGTPPLLCSTARRSHPEIAIGN
jgi:hypothetical protein